MPGRTLGVLAAAALVGVATPLRAIAQDETRSKCPPVSSLTNVDTNPQYSISLLAKPKLDALRDCLSHAMWTSALSVYFGNYRKEFSDWVVYIDSMGKERQGFSGEQEPRSMLVGKRYIWVVVFSEKRLMRTKAVMAVPDTTKRSLIAHAAAATAANGTGGEAAPAVDSATIAAADSALFRSKAKRDSIAAAAAAGRNSLAHEQASGERARRTDTVKLQRVEKEAADAKAAAEADVAKAQSALDAAKLKLAVDTLGYNVAKRKAESDAEMAVAVTRITTEATDTADLRFERRTVVYQQDPLLTTLIVGLLRPFGASAPATPSLADSLKTIRLVPVSADTTDSMVAAFARFGLIENTAVELVLLPVRGKEFPDSAKGHPGAKVQAIYGNLSNAKRHAFELGVLAAMTYGPRVPTYNSNLQVTSLTSPLNFNGYVTAIWNFGCCWFPRPDWLRFGQPPWRKGSVGLFVGTNVLSGGSIGSQLVQGITFGHLISDGGVSVGVADLQEPAIRSGQTVSVWKFPLLLGLDLRF